MLISLESELLSSDYLFKLVDKYLVVLFAFLINLSFYVIFTRNKSNVLVYLFKKLFFNLVIDLEANRYYYIDSKDIAKLALKLLK